MNAEERRWKQIVRPICVHLRSSAVALSLFALALAVPARAQDGTAYGIVFEQGRPIVGIPVVVDDRQTLITDADGPYFANLPRGEHRLRVALHGYRPLERTITMERDGRALADFLLEPVLQVAVSSLPAMLTRGAPGLAQLLVTNTHPTAYTIETAGLQLFVEGKERSGDFLVQPNPVNPAEVKPGETAILTFTITPAATAPLGRVILRAGVFAFDTAYGENLLSNSSLERVNVTGTSAPPWGFGIDNRQFYPGATGAIVATTAMTGRRSGEVRVPVARPGDVRAYWNNSVAIKPSKRYVLSGYVKTQQIASDTAFGAAVYVPVTGNNRYQGPNAPFIDGTSDWRKSVVAFQTSGDGNSPIAHCRGEIQQGTGLAWFDNFALTEGTVDASLTVTSADHSVEIVEG